MAVRLISAICLVLLICCANGFQKYARHQLHSLNSISFHRERSAVSPHTKPLTTLEVAAETTIISSIAGSLAGALGVGAAYPMDSLKTKAQTYAQSDANAQSLGLLGMYRIVKEQEGLSGFYKGVTGVMAAQGIIKATAFASNDWALHILQENPCLGWASTPFGSLCIAAGFAGAVSSFVINPIERVKILMQADTGGNYLNEIQCAACVLREDGLRGLAFRGLDATLWREIPGYGLYFVAYSLLMQTAAGQSLGPFAPLVCGAAAGMLCWIPVYPADVVKTAMQNTAGPSSVGAAQAPKGFFATAADLRRRGGWGIFFDGLTPKMLRAAINHAVTFYVYDTVMAFAS